MQSCVPRSTSHWKMLIAPLLPGRMLRVLAVTGYLALFVDEQHVSGHDDYAHIGK